MLRRILDLRDSITEVVIIPLCLNYPLRSELKIQAFSRTYIELLDSRQSRRRTISVPLITFINVFRLYRNLYRLLIGIYFIIAVLSTRERNRQANVLPLILSPYRSNFANVVEAIKLLTVLDRSVKVYIPRIGTVLLVVFTFAFLRDIPQQQKNSRIKI